MGVIESALLRTFGRPTGLLGRLGGRIMARTNGAFARSAIGLLDVRPDDRVLEVGFGPGVGIDRSREMVEQATARNAEAIGRGVVDLHHGSVESLPFEDGAFDAALAINSLQVWPDARAGLREIGRVLRPGGRMALGFTPYSGQPRAGITDLVSAAGFAQPRLVETEHGFCMLARKP